VPILFPQAPATVTRWHAIVRLIGNFPRGAVEMPTEFPRERYQSPVIGPDNRDVSRGHPEEICDGIIIRAMEAPEQHRTPCRSIGKEAGQLMEFGELT
jgi:hypothetical protein